MSSMFLTQGDDPYGHLRHHMSAIEKPAFEGLWSTIDLQPDLFSPQRFLVGVVVADISGEWQFRLLSDLKKFDCIYRKSSAYIKDLFEVAELSLQRAAKSRARFDQVGFDCANLTISTPWPTSGHSIEQVLSRLFSDVIAMEPSEEKAQRDFVSLDTDQVRKLVNEQLKKISDMRYEQIVVESKEVLVEDVSGDSHVLDFNLRTQTGAGSVISAVYKTPSTIELNILRASRDLTIFSRARNVDNLALFVMSAKSDSMEPSEYHRIGDMLDEQGWRLERQGFRVFMSDETPEIAREVLEWSEL